mgnify:CR=1 FL=1
MARSRVGFGRGCAPKLRVDPVLRRAGLDLLHLRWNDRPLETLARADALFMGGGNTYALLKRLRASLPHARLGWLVSRSSRGLTGLNRSLGLAALHPKEPLVSGRLVKRCHRLGLAMHVWVLNRARRIRELEALGVDGVMTDDPRQFTM